LCLSLQSSLRLLCYVKELRELKMDFRSRSVILPVYITTSCNHTPSERNTRLHILLFSSPEPVDRFFFSLFRITADMVGVSCLAVFYFCCKTFDAIFTMTHFSRALNEPSLFDRILRSHQTTTCPAPLCARLKLHC